MSIRKRIAVLAGELEEEYPKLFLQGFLSKAFEYDLTTPFKTVMNWKV